MAQAALAFGHLSFFCSFWGRCREIVQRVRVRSLLLTYHKTLRAAFAHDPQLSTKFIRLSVVVTHKYKFASLSTLLASPLPGLF